MIQAWIKGYNILLSSFISSNEIDAEKIINIYYLRFDVYFFPAWQLNI